MSDKAIIQSFHLDDGRQVFIETGRLAKQADGAVVVKMGDTMVMATVVAVKEAKADAGFFPLSVEYKEKYAATGKFPGGFFKREARPSEYEILIARLVDRALRPLFPDNYYAETQVFITLISGEKETPPDALAALAASAALSVSDIPFGGPISEVRVARIEGRYVINPNIPDLEKADLDLMVAATIDNIMMVEGECKEVSEDVMIEALEVAHKAIKTQCQAQLELASKVEKSKPKREFGLTAQDPELERALREFAYPKAYELAKSFTRNKLERHEKFAAIKAEFESRFTEEELVEKAPLISQYYHEIEKDAVRNLVLDERVRIDGRKTDEIRPIWCDIDYLPSAHGSSIFTRGETQALVTTTLGTKLDEQTIDGAVIEGTSNFMLHYNFPPFSTGEVKMARGTSRREIGHGNLAQRALKPVIPGEEENPYTIRVVSDILESNGSSSMATVCGGTLALMDAGVKITKPVSGIAMGLIMNKENGKYAILPDILGDEDHLGDMDFKVTGTRDGITACQMDIKVDGLTTEVMKEALEQAKRGRLHILDIMKDTISEPREDYKPHVPRIEKMIIDKEFIGAVIGPGGKIIQEIQRETGATIVIEEKGNSGVIDIFSSNKESIEKAKAWIKGIVAVPEVGETYTGKVKNLAAFGAFIEILPGKDGLLHISEMAWNHVKKVEDVLKVGDEVTVKLIGIDDKTGKLKLSKKALEAKPKQRD